MASWTKISGTLYSWTSTQALTDSAPTQSTDGVSLNGIGRIEPFLSAPNGQTLTGSGGIDWYIYSDALGAWVLRRELRDGLADWNGDATAALPPIQNTKLSGRIAGVANGVGVSSGTQVTLQLHLYDRDTGTGP